MIFNFFKKAPLKSFIPEGFVDIHNHVLPSIDDGSQSMKDTSELLDKMHKELNFSQIIAINQGKMEGYGIGKLFLFLVLVM